MHEYAIRGRENGSVKFPIPLFAQLMLRGKKVQFNKWMLTWSYKDIQNIIESTFCTFDLTVDRMLTDHIFLKILELLLDKYYFKENIRSINVEWVDKGFTLVTRAIQEELADVPDEYYKNNREYLLCGPKTVQRPPGIPGFYSPICGHKNSCRFKCQDNSPPRIVRVCLCRTDRG